MRDLPFDVRLAGAREVVAMIYAAPSPEQWFPPHVTDQVVASVVEARADILRLADRRALDPERDWRFTEKDMCDPAEAERLMEVEARILVATSDCRFCPHLKRQPVQAVYAFLAVRQMVCKRCLATVRNAPADEADRCDWCGARGVAKFHPIQIQSGPRLVIGDCCRPCAQHLSFDCPCEGCRVAS